MKRACVALSELGLGDRQQAGGKAAVLGELARHGLPVPDGFVVINPETFDGRCSRFDGRLIARSSAPLEDGALASFAGQLESVPELVPGPMLLEAVRQISKPGEQAKAYARQLGLELSSCVPVLVQQQVDAELAGVLFTVDPRGAERRRFTIDWGTPTGITDGTTESHFVVFDPLAPERSAIGEPRVENALRELVELAFRTAVILRANGPLDLEWLLDRAGKLWLVQARPVTAYQSALHPQVAGRLSEGFTLVSPQPVSRLAAWSFELASKIDQQASGAHHAHFERTSEGPWLLARSRKRRNRERIGAHSPWGFALSWTWKRRTNLRFALRALMSWELAGKRAARWAHQTLAKELTIVSDAQLRKLVDCALIHFELARRLHAALWYPVDLVKDLEELRALRGAAPPVLPGSHVRTKRDRSTALLVLSIRGGGSAHPSWEELRSEAQEQIVRHLCEHPYAFGDSAEVQDLAAWSSWREDPRSWWNRWEHASSEELERQARTPVEPASLIALSGRRLASLPELILRAVASRFAPLKDDRVELLALVSSAARRVLVELERRKAAREGFRGWVFELAPDELRALARDELRATELRERAQRRLRERLLESFNPPRMEQHVLQVVADERPSAFAGAALAAGVATARARRVSSIDEAWRLLKSGEILVTEEIRPAFTAVMPRAAGLVCRRGSPLSHAAIVARELGIPAVALPDLRPIETGTILRVDGSRGDVTVVAAGAEEALERPTVPNCAPD